MSELAAVKGDLSDHGGSALHASNTNGKMFVNGKEIVLVDSTADGDLAGHPAPPTDAATGSSKLFVNGIQVHRHNDLRKCGAQTIVSGQSSLYVE